MIFFVSEGVPENLRTIIFGELPDECFIKIEPFWTMNDILKEVEIEFDPNEDNEIPRGLSQLKPKDGNFERSIFILNL